MPQQNNDNAANRDSCHDDWQVMWHLSPRLIETLLQKDSAGLFRRPGEEPLPPYRFYVPYQYMPVLAKERPADDTVSDKRYAPQQDMGALRGDFHGFVFIQAPAERVRAIVGSDWNTKGRLRLYYYRDTSRHPVTIPDAEMRQLIAAIQDRHLQFYIDQPVDDFAPGDRVILKVGPWAGRRGDIRRIALKKGRLTMTIALNILGRTKSINFTDIRVGDVVFEDVRRGRMLSDDPITNYEEELIDVLSHRFARHQASDVTEQDLSRLKRLATYDHIFVDDDAELARFVSLKLMCAYLLHNVRRRDLYLRQVLAMLGETTQPANDAEAYLMTALWMVTREARWRTALKAYRNAHPDSAPVLRRYHAILKDMHAVSRDKRHGQQKQST